MASGDANMFDKFFRGQMIPIQNTKRPTTFRVKSMKTKRPTDVNDMTDYDDNEYANKRDEPADEKEGSEDMDDDDILEDEEEDGSAGNDTKGNEHKHNHDNARIDSEKILRKYRVKEFDDFTKDLNVKVRNNVDLTMVWQKHKIVSFMFAQRERRKVITYMFALPDDPYLINYRGLLSIPVAVGGRKPEPKALTSFFNSDNSNQKSAIEKYIEEGLNNKSIESGATVTGGQMMIVQIKAGELEVYKQGEANVYEEIFPRIGLTAAGINKDHHTSYVVPDSGSAAYFAILSKGQQNQSVIYKMSDERNRVVELFHGVYRQDATLKSQYDNYGESPRNSPFFLVSLTKNPAFAIWFMYNLLNHVEEFVKNTNYKLDDCALSEVQMKKLRNHQKVTGAVNFIDIHPVMDNNAIGQRLRILLDKGNYKKGDSTVEMAWTITDDDPKIRVPKEFAIWTIEKYASILTGIKLLDKNKITIAATALGVNLDQLKLSPVLAQFIMDGSAFIPKCNYFIVDIDKKT